jgi:hypothetical protein
MLNFSHYYQVLILNTRVIDIDDTTKKVIHE